MPDGPLIGAAGQPLASSCLVFFGILVASCIETVNLGPNHEIALAMPKAAAAARPPMTTVWTALRIGPVPVKWPLT